MVEVRQFHDDEFESYLEIREKALTIDPDAFGDTIERFQSRDVFLKRQRFTRHTDNEDHLIVGAFSGSDCVGMAGLVRLQPDAVRGKIWGVFVDPEYRGQHLGKKMLELIVQESNGFEWLNELILSVKTNNQEAIGVYEEVGFETFEPEEKNPLLMSQCAQETHMRKPRSV